MEEHHSWCPWVTDHDDVVVGEEKKEKVIPGWKKVLISLVNSGSKSDRSIQVCFCLFDC